MRTLISRIFVATAVFCLCPFSHGQGFNADGLFQHFDVDHMNVKGATSVIRIPLVSFPERGTNKTLDFYLMANTPNWQPQASCDLNSVHCIYQYQPAPMGFNNETGFSGYGFGPSVQFDGAFAMTSQTFTYLSNPMTYVSYLVNTITDMSGAAHKLWTDSSNPLRARTVDGSGYLAKFDPTSGALINVLDRSGRAYGIPVYNSSTNAYDVNIDDIDQNRLVIHGGSSGDGVGSITDTVNRTIPLPLFSTASTDVSDCATVPSGFPAPTKKTYWTVPGYSQPFVICYVPINIRTNFYGYGPGAATVQENPPSCGDESGGDPGCGDSGSQVYYESVENDFPVMQSVKLPNGTSWIFGYDSAPSGSTTVAAYGDITRVIEPTGGSIFYCYNNMPMIWTTQSPSYYGYGLMRFITHRVVDSSSDPNTQAFDCAHPGTYSGTQAVWSYDEGASSGYSNYVVTVTGPATSSSPSGDDATFNFAAEYTSPGGTTLYSEVDKYYQGLVSGGNLLKTVTKNEQRVLLPWSADPASTAPEWEIHHLSEVTTLDGVSLGTTLTNSYSGGFVPAVRLCQTATTTCYNAATTANDTGVGQIDGTGNAALTSATNHVWNSPNATFADANLLDLPLNSTKSDSTSSMQTTYDYDAGGYSHVGHLTGITRVNTSGASPTSHMSYNSNGMLYQTFDPMSPATAAYTYNYDSSGLFPITITGPLGSEHYTYDPNTGAVLTHTDLNNNTTTNTYDPSGRLWAVRNPDARRAGPKSTAIQLQIAHGDIRHNHLP